MFSVPARLRTRAGTGLALRRYPMRSGHHQKMGQASTRESIEFYSGDLNTLVDEKLAPRYRNIRLVTRPRASSGSLWSFFCISTTEVFDLLLETSFDFG